MAGCTPHTPPATIPTAEAAPQALVEGFTIGMRFHAAPVVRLADAKPVQLGHAARADGAWRIYAFADSSGQKLRKLMDVLAASQQSPLSRFPPNWPALHTSTHFQPLFPHTPPDLNSTH